MAVTVEAKLKRLFDFQRFVREPGLQDIIDETLSDPGLRRLSDDDLDMVAAGTDTGSGNQDNNENTIPFHCTCGYDFNITLGVKYCKCPNCQKIHYFNG